MRRTGLIIFLLSLVAILVTGYFVKDSLFTSAQITNYTNRLTQDPNDFEAAYQLGVLYFRTQDYQNSAKYYEIATQIDKASVVAFNNLGNAYKKLQLYEDAETNYQTAITINPKYTTAYINLVSLYQNWPADDNQIKKIPDLLKQGITNTNSSDLLRELIDYYSQIGDTTNQKKYQNQLDQL